MPEEAIMAQEVAVYRVFEHNLLVLCESDDFAVHIDCFMRNLRINEPNTGIRLAIFVSQNGRGKGQLQFVCPERNLVESSSLGGAAWLVFRRLFLRLAQESMQSHYVMHASAIGDQAGRAALIIGSSDAGKTSALIALLQRGYCMVCDDYCHLQFSNGLLVSLPVGVTVNAKTFELFPALVPLARSECNFFLQREHQWTINPGDLYDSARAYGTYTPTHFFFLHPHFGLESSIAEYTADEALWWFQAGQLYSRGLAVQSGSSILNYHMQSFELARKFLKNARFFKVMNGDIQQTADLIAAAFGQEPGSLQNEESERA